MNEVRIYRILESQGFSKENAQEFVDEMKSSDSNAATKNDIMKLEVKMSEGFAEVYKRITAQTTVYLCITGGLLALFKAADIYMYLNK